MLALRSAPPVFGIAEAERVARDVYGLALAVDVLPGERDCNFHARGADRREYVLKIIDGAADPVATAAQIRVLHHLGEQDSSLMIPRPYPTLSGLDMGTVTQHGLTYATCLLGYLRGRPLSEVAVDAAMLAKVGWTLSRLDRALRGFLHPGLDRRIAWDVRNLPELLQIAPYAGSPDVRRAIALAADRIQARLPALRGFHAQAIHGDCHPGNLLVDGSAGALCGVLDFGDMIHGPAILEPAVAMSELLLQGLTEPKALTVLLESYADMQPLDAAEVAALFDLVAARHATTLVLHAWRERHDPAGAGVLGESASRAASSLDLLLGVDAAALTREWHRAAHTSVADAVVPVDLERRHRLLGVGAPLFYAKPLQFVRARDVWLYDREGRAHLDAYNNVPHVGHCHPRVVRAIARQAGLLATHTRYLHAGILDYAERLLARCPPHLDACIFVNSGSEANDVAWQLARFATGRGGALIMAHAYHGVTEAAAALTPAGGHPRAAHVVTLAPPPEGCRVGDSLSDATEAAAVRNAGRAVSVLAERGFAPAAFFLDTALTSSGIHDAPEAWVAAVIGRLRASGALIVADEVQYGLGRSGSHFWGFERRGMSPDVVTLGKPMGNGYPMGAVIARRSMIEAFQAEHGFFSTFGGNPVAAAAGLAVLDVIDAEGLVANADTTGTYLRQVLEDTASRRGCLGVVRGNGLLLGLEVRAMNATDAARRTTRMVDCLASVAKILVGTEGPGGNMVKIRPPMTFRTEHADRLAGAIDAAAAAIDEEEGD